MDKLIHLKLHPEKYHNLLENSLWSIPFNIIVGAVLTIDFLFRDIPKYLILTWYAGLVIISLIRWFYSKWVLVNKSYLKSNYFSLIYFIVLSFIMGCTWGLSYVIFLPYITLTQEVVLILIFGGMAAGAATSLSGYLPAYYFFILPMFIPIIYYNYSFFHLDRLILATMSLLFIIMIITIAKMNHKLLKKVFQLSSQKDSLINQLSVSNKKLEETNKEIHLMSITDSMTGLYNRRCFDMTLIQALNRAKRNKYSLGLILIDIDEFKYINDSFGHPYGDSYLIFVASILKNSMRRAIDMVFRLGGDEFAAILENINMDEMKELCDGIRNSFSKKNKHKNVTLSIGILCIESANGELKNIISAVDKLLYIAKEKGKNQTITQIL